MARKIKLAESLEKHDDVEVRLMADFLKSAVEHARNGNLIRFASCVRLMSDYERRIPADTMAKLYEAAHNG